MGLSSSKKQSANKESNGSSSSGNRKTTSEEFSKRPFRSADAIKREAYVNSVLSKDRQSSNTLYRKSETGGSSGVRKSQNDTFGSHHVPSIYPNLNKETSFTSPRTSQVNKSSYFDVPECNLKANSNSSHTVPRNIQLNSNSSSFQPETRGSSSVRQPQTVNGSQNASSMYHGMNMKTETTHNSSRSYLMNNSSLSNLPEGNVKSNRNSAAYPCANMKTSTAKPPSLIRSVPAETTRCNLNTSIKTESSKYDANTRSNLCGPSFSTLSDNSLNIRKSGTNSPCAINNLSDPVKNNLNTTEKVVQNKIVNQHAEVSLKHETFLKRLVANYDRNASRRNRGFYCSVCNFYKIFYGKLSNPPEFLKHDQTEVHQNAIVDKENIKRFYCRQCKAHFFGDVLFWMDHLNMDLHKLFADKRNSQQISSDNGNLESFKGSNKKKNIKGVSQADKPFKVMPSMSLFDYLSLQKDNDHYRINSDLMLKKDVAENFYKKLINDDKGNYSFYCHACEFWTDNNEVWKNHNGIHETDLKFKSTVKNCVSCRLIIIGNDKLKQFHCNDEEHENLKKLLAGEINKNQSLDSSDSSDSDSNEDDDDKTGRIGKKLSALLIKGLPHDVKRSDVFHSMIQFGKVDKIFMHYVGPTSAKVLFKFRNIARNLVNNGVPISIQGKTVELSLIEI